MHDSSQDIAWVLQIYPQMNEDDLEWFLERIAIVCDSDIKASQARNFTLSYYLENKANHEN